MSISPAVATTSSSFFRFRLVTLLILTTWAAIVCAGLKSPTAPWTKVIIAAAPFSFIAAGLLAWFCTEQRCRCKDRTRIAWCGYAIFCSLYFAYFHLAISAAWSNLLTASPNSVPSLFYYPSLLYRLIHGEWVRSFPFVDPQFTPFMEIYHHSLATFLGLLGSLLAQYLYATQPREKPTNANPQP